MPWVHISTWARMLRSHRGTRNVLSFTILVALIYCALYLAVGPDLLPGGNAWSTLLIFLAAHVGGALCGVLGVPPLLGMLLAGLLLRNATPSLVAGLPTSWSATLRALALGTIFLRSGLELDLQIFRRVGPAAVRLLLLPGLVEAFTTAGAAIGIMRMPPFWALTQGFILKAVGPAVVIQTMFDLQKKGLGVNKGIPAIVVGAASFDDMVAISGYSLFSSFAMSSVTSPSSSTAEGGGASATVGPHSLVWTLLHGPLDISLGVVAGLLGASLCAATRLWDTPLKRTTVVFASALALLFALYRYDFRGGGALAALVLGLAVNVYWERGSLFFWGLGRRSGLTRGPQPRYAAEVEARVGLFWRVVAQPLLFGIIGSLVNLRTVSGDTIPKSLALIAIGMAVRIPTTYFAMTGAGLTRRERVFVAIAWTPKATVQAALGAQPLDMITAAAGPNSPLVAVGHEILTTSVFAIIVCANIGVSAIHFLAPRWLHRTVPPAAVLAAAGGGGGGGGATERRGSGTAAGEPAGPAAAAAVESARGGGGGASDADADGGGGGGGAARAAGTGDVSTGGSGVRQLRVGPVGYQWAEESFSPTPRSVSRSVQHEGGGVMASLRSAGGGGGGGGGRDSGGLWCRCADGPLVAAAAGAGGKAVKGAEASTTTMPVARAWLPRGGRPPRPPLPPRPCDEPKLIHDGGCGGGGGGGGSGSGSDSDLGTAGGGGRGGADGDGDSATASTDEGSFPEKDAAAPYTPHKTRSSTVAPLPPRLESAGLRRCQRCRGLVPPSPQGHDSDGDSFGAVAGCTSSPPTTVPRPPGVRRSSKAVRCRSAGDNSSISISSDVEAGVGVGAATAARPYTPTASRRNSAPAFSDARLTEHFLNAAAMATGLRPPPPPPPPQATSASGLPAVPPGRAPLLQRQLLELENAAATVAELAARVAALTAAAAAAATSATAAVAAPTGAEGVNALGNADGGGGGDRVPEDAQQLAAQAAALRRAASAVRRHVSAVVAGGHQGDVLSGEEADDEEGNGGGGGTASGDVDEPPPPETAGEFFRRVAAAAAAATGSDPEDEAAAAPPLAGEAAAAAAVAVAAAAAAVAEQVVIPMPEGLQAASGGGGGTAAPTQGDPGGK